MICSFCQQWNPPKLTRCVFCNNTRDSETDATTTGRPPEGTLIKLDSPGPRRKRRTAGKFRAGPLKVSVDFGPWIGGAVTVVITALWLTLC